MSLQDNISEKYETWSNREMVIAEHLRNYYNALKGFSTVLASTRFNTRMGAQYLNWSDFLISMMTVLKQAEIKTTKLKSLKIKEATKQSGDKVNFDIIHDKIVKVKKMMLSSSISKDGSIEDSLEEYEEVLTMIGILYDKLGYSSPERKVTRTGILSDIQLEGMDDEGMEINAID